MTDEAYRARARARRARLIWFGSTAPVAVVGVLIALPMAFAGINAQSAIALTKEKHYDRAYAQLGWIAGHDLVEQWRADYDLGTIRVMQGEGWQGVDLLERALRGVPEEHRCEVQDNLALALDDAVAHDSSEAELFSAWAKLVETGSPVPAEAEGMTAAELEEQAKEFRHAADAAEIESDGLRQDATCNGQNNDPQPQPSPTAKPTDPPTSGTSEDDETEQQRQDELEDRQKDAESDAEEQRQTGEGGLGPLDEDGDDTGPGPTPNW